MFKSVNLSEFQIGAHRVSCLVQAVGYRGGTRPSRPIHIQNITSNENELRHDDETLHWIRRA